MVIAVDRLGDQAVALFSDGSSHAIRRRVGRDWHEWRAWKGDEVTAFCACGQSAVVCEPEGRIRLFGTDDALLSEEGRHWFNGAAALDQDSVLLGGVKGALGTVHIRERTIDVTSLAECGVSKPGRDILNIGTLDSDPMLVGRNRLLVRFRGTQSEELLQPGASSERRFDVHHAVRVRGEVWTSGLSGVAPALARVSDQGLVPAEHPPLGDAAPPIYSLDDELYLLTDAVWIFKGSGWQEASTAAGSPLVGMTTHEGNAIVVAESGQCLLREKGVWHPAP